MSGGIRKILALALVAALALSIGALSGCQPAGEGTGGGDTPVAGGTMTFYINEPAFIDPYNGQESEGIQVIQAISDSLVDFDFLTSEIKPGAAETWEPNEDASVWTFKLREGAKFHDGTDVTAADFKYAWERIADVANESEIAYHLSAIEGTNDDGNLPEGATEITGVKVIDELTLEVTLKYPFADFQYVVGHPSLGPVPKAAVEADPEAFAAMPISNGPFKMAEPWKPGQYIKVVKADGYYGDEPYIDGIDFMIFTDQDTAFLEFEAGNLDFTDMPTGQIQSSIDKYGESPDGYSIEPGKQTLLGPELAVYNLVVNCTNETFKDPLVRQAFSMAIDRQAICDTVFEGTRAPATGEVPPGIVGFMEGQWPYSKYDPEGAAAKLAEAGFEGGAGFPKVVLEYNTGSGHEDILQLVQQDLKNNLGVESELKGTEWAQYLDRLDTEDYMIGRLGWQADYPTMDNFLTPLFKSTASDNYSNYTNADVDKALEDARPVPDDAERVKMYQDAEKAIGEDSPVIPLMFYRHTRVASDRVMDGVFSPMSLFDFGHVWLKGAGEATQ